MKQYIAKYGLTAGVLIIATMVLGSMLSGGAGASGFSEVFGYAVMLLALSLIFVGIKRYRDRELGGVIRFSQALLLGVAISAVAGIGYVASWEIYLNMTDHDFIHDYTESVLAKKREAGVVGAEYAKAEEEMTQMTERYQNPLFRLPMTFLEIFPVGLLISLISAGLLRKSEFLPAQAARQPAQSTS